MTETIHLMPPEAGPSANPVLFAVAAALAELLPLTVAVSQPATDARPLGPQPFAPQRSAEVPRA